MAEIENTNGLDGLEDADFESLFGDEDDLGEEEQAKETSGTTGAQSSEEQDELSDSDFEDFGDFEDFETGVEELDSTGLVDAKPLENTHFEEGGYSSAVQPKTEELGELGEFGEFGEFGDADTDGVILGDGYLLTEDEKDDENIVAVNRRDWISSTGEVVVMDTSSDDGFSLEYIDINNIAIAHRIRNSTNVEDLVKSIKSTGLLHPLVVAPTATKGIYVLLHGYRRILACARVGIRKIPCIVNTKVNTSEIPVLEAMYNHNRSYTIKEMIAYIDYLEKEKGILSASMIEYLLQMNSGDYTKLKDILNDDDDDIVSKLMDGTYTIDQAFKKLEQRRKKESAEEKAIRKAEKVYEDEKESGVEAVAGTGEQADESTALSDEEIEDIMVRAGDIDTGLEDESLDQMVREDAEIKGFETEHQEVGNRTTLDPALRKAVLARDDTTCQCCKRGGTSEWSDVLDVHHIMPVFLDNGTSNAAGDKMDNLITLCLVCHRMVHLYSYGDLHISPDKTAEELAKMTDDERVIYNDERMRLKRVVRLGSIIRKGMEKRGIKRLEAKKNNPIGNIGRNMPGKGRQNPDL